METAYYIYKAYVCWELINKMFIDFDKIFNPEKTWKNIKLTDRNPCVNCEVTREYEKHRDQIRMSEGFADEILEKCRTCMDYFNWKLDCHRKLKWYEDHDERLK